MSTLLVPLTVSANSANVWVGAFGNQSPPVGLSFTVAPGLRAIHVPDAQWTRVDGAGTLPTSKCFVQIVRVCDLKADTRYQLSGSDGGSAVVYTLPKYIPTASELPFSLLLGSCFFHGQDQVGQVGGRFKALPTPYTPRLKLLTGDQVYLDISYGYSWPILFVRSKEDFARHSLTKYLRTWSQKEPSFQSLLRHGGAFLIADDHEYWNNSPNGQLQLPATWWRNNREGWRQVGQSLFEDFQSDAPLSAGSPRQFQIGRLSFFVADTRVNREPGEERVMQHSDFDRLVRWLHRGSDPGVLVIGQPLFQERSGWFKKRFADRALADYAQYDELVRAITHSSRSLLVLSGDVHYGRVATATLRGGDRERQLHEVIASPLSLLRGTGSNCGKNAPSMFPHDSVPGCARVEVKTRYRTGKEHFATLRLSSHGGRIRVEVCYWFTKVRPGKPVRSSAIAPLYLD